MPQSSPSVPPTSAPPPPTGPYYITTPIYYVNDKPHIGHCYTTVVADVAARLQRAIRGGGDDVFFLTGTDEHADKVVISAQEHGTTPQEWADRNAAEFQRAFADLGVTNDDFIRTTEARHKEKVAGYIRRLQASGDVYMGDYTGWYDPGQEEYVTESAAKEANYASAVSGKPLVKRTERNYFLRLSAYEGKLLAHLAANPGFVEPEARRNEVLGRVRQGLQDVPISRAVTEEATTRWGIRMPDDPSHRIYVWIEALLSYFSTVDTPERKKFWPASVHLMAKEILWFHAVIWPAMLMAMGEELPGTVYAHSYYVREGRKMSKSLGNFIDIDLVRAYCARYGTDALRWYLATQGPLGTSDADFSHPKFVEVYNADLANGIGNCTSRVGNMIEKYFGGAMPDPGGLVGQDAYRHASGRTWAEYVDATVAAAVGGAGRFDLNAAFDAARDLVRSVDGFINQTQPFKVAKRIEEETDGRPNREHLAAILYICAEALRAASLLFAPVIPARMALLWRTWGCEPAAGVPLAELARFGGAHALRPGQKIAKGEPLFMRVDPAEAAPEAHGAPAPEAGDGPRAPGP